MKKLITTIAMLLLFAVGCTDQTSITSPEQSVQTQEPNWIALPQVEGMHVNTDWTISKIINGSAGGYISRGVAVLATGFAVQARIDFPAGAFSGSKTITMTLSDQNTSITFGPSMVFLNAATYNVTYSGLDLSGINPSTVKFVYIAADGSVQYTVNDGIVVDLAAGKLKVINAKIPHFSRYGFVN